MLGPRIGRVRLVEELQIEISAKIALYTLNFLQLFYLLHISITVTSLLLKNYIFNNF